MSAKKTLSKFNNKYKRYCNQCGKTTKNVFKCSNCEISCCNLCYIALQTTLMMQLFETRFKSLPTKRCKGQIFCDAHSEVHPSQKMNISLFFEHLFDKRKIKCHTILCSAKQYCPNCLIRIKYHFCAECASDSKKYLTPNSTYCDDCIMKAKKLHWIPDYKGDDGYKNEWTQALSISSGEDHAIKWLCNIHCISHLHK